MRNDIAMHVKGEDSVALRPSCAVSWIDNKRCPFFSYRTGYRCLFTSSFSELLRLALFKKCGCFDDSGKTRAILNVCEMRIGRRFNSFLRCAPATRRGIVLEHFMPGCNDVLLFSASFLLSRQSNSVSSNFVIPS